MDPSSSPAAGQPVPGERVPGVTAVSPSGAEYIFTENSLFECFMSSAGTRVFANDTKSAHMFTCEIKNEDFRPILKLLQITRKENSDDEHSKYEFICVRPDQTAIVCISSTKDDVCVYHFCVASSTGEVVASFRLKDPSRPDAKGRGSKSRFPHSKILKACATANYFMIVLEDLIVVYHLGAAVGGERMVATIATWAHRPPTGPYSENQLRSTALAESLSGAFMLSFWDTEEKPTVVRGGGASEDASSPSSATVVPSGTARFSIRHGSGVPVVIAAESGVQFAQFSNSGGLLVIGSEDGTVLEAFDTVSGHSVGKMYRGRNPAKIEGVAFSGDDNYLLVWSDRPTVHLFNITIAAPAQPSTASWLASFVTSSTFVKNYIDSKASSATGTLTGHRDNIMGALQRVEGGVWALMLSRDGYLHRMFFKDGSPNAVPKDPLPLY